MQVADRRHFLHVAISGAVVATAAATGLVSVLPRTADAAPPIGRILPDRLDGSILQAQVVPPADNRYDFGRQRRSDRRNRRWDRRHARRTRRWVCWWERGRRICDWRWV